MTVPEIAYLGLGSNLGDRRATIESAICELKQVEGVEVVITSRLIETDPVGPVRQAPFLNGATKIRTTLSARSLLDICLALEKDHGRDRSVVQSWGPRTLDLDLLLYGDQVIDEPGLCVPHPLMHERGFVLVPLSEIAPLVRHPVLDTSIQDLRKRLLLTS